MTDAKLPFTNRKIDYYRQRASAPGTLLIAEATLISRSSAKYSGNVPGIFTEAQIAAWRDIVDAVHANGCFMYCQLWHFGGRTGLPEPGKKSDAAEYLKNAAPDKMTETNIWEAIDDYAQAARNAIAAGFDGVEIHGGNGYLVDQYLQEIYNHRSDAWGGSIEKRARFAIEVTNAVIAAVGADRTAIRLSPFFSDALLQSGTLTHNPYPQFAYLVQQLKPLQLAYLHLIEARMFLGDNNPASDNYSVGFLVKIWANQSPVFLAGGFGSPGAARKAIDKTWREYDVAVAIGRYFVSNPDLVFRMKEGVDFTEYDRSSFYTPKKAKGYTDYPFSAQFLAKARMPRQSRL